MTKAEARLSSSSGLSSSQATTASSDADSGIDTGVSPRISAAAFGESSCINAPISPSQSIMYIDSVSERNSVIIPSTPNQSVRYIDGLSLSVFCFTWQHYMII